MISFKERLSLKERKRQAEVVLKKHPDRIPVIVEKEKGSDIAMIDRCKYLVPQDFSVAQLLYVVRKRIKLAPEQGLFFFLSDHTIVTTSALLSDIYDKNKDADGFLYVTYTGENVFG